MAGLMDYIREGMTKTVPTQPPVSTPSSPIMTGAPNLKDVMNGRFNVAPPNAAGAADTIAPDPAKAPRMTEYGRTSMQSAMNDLGNKVTPEQMRDWQSASRGAYTRPQVDAAVQQLGQVAEGNAPKYGVPKTVNTDFTMKGGAYTPPPEPSRALTTRPYEPNFQTDTSELGRGGASNTRGPTGWGTRAAAEAAPGEIRMIPDMRSQTAKDFGAIKGDLGRLGSYIGDKAGAAMEALSNPYTRLATKAAAPVGVALSGASALTDKSGYKDPLEKLFGLDNLNQRVEAGNKAFNEGDYATFAGKTASAVPHAIYASTLRPLVELGGGIADKLMGPAPAAPQTADQYRQTPLTYDAQKREFSRGPTNMDEYKQQQQMLKDAALEDATKLRPGENFAAVIPPGGRRATPEETAQARRELSIPDPTQRVSGGAGNQTSGNSPLGVPGVSGRDPNADLRNIYEYVGSHGGNIHALQAYMNAYAHMYGTDASRPYYEAQAKYYASPKPLKPGEEAQADANSFRDEYMQTVAAANNPDATPAQQSAIKRHLDYLNQRRKFDQQVYHGGDPNELDLPALMEAAARNKHLGAP